MRYYAIYDESGILESLDTVSDNAILSPFVTELTQEEYETLLASFPVPEEPEYVDPVDEALAILSGEVTE